MSFREQIIALDNFACRNPKCLSVEHEDSYTRRILSVHHIVYRSHIGPDTPENTITVCKRCDDAIHLGNGSITDPERQSGRVFMLSMLDSLERARDYRWGDVHDKLRLRYGEMA